MGGGSETGVTRDDGMLRLVPRFPEDALGFRPYGDTGRVRSGERSLLSISFELLLSAGRGRSAPYVVEPEEPLVWPSTPGPSATGRELPASSSGIGAGIVRGVPRLLGVRDEYRDGVSRDGIVALVGDVGSRVELEGCGR